MALYTSIMTILLYVGTYCGKRYKKIFLSCAFLIIVLIAGLRNFTVGVDTTQYYYSFQMIANLQWNELLGTRYEIGYVLAARLVAVFSKNPQVWIFITSLFISISIVNFIYRYSKNVTISLFLYISLGYYFDSMNILRQSLALCIILWGVSYLLEKKYIKYMMFVVLACSFHTSAVVALLYIIGMKLPMSKLKVKNIVVAAIIVFIFAMPVFNFLKLLFPKYMGYNSENFAFTNFFGTAINALQAFVIFYSYQLIMKRYLLSEQNNEQNTLEFRLSKLTYYLLAISFILEILAIRINIVERIAEYLSFFVIIGMPLAINQIKQLDDKKKFVLCLLMIAALHMVIVLAFRPNWHGVVPYKFFFTN